MHLEKIRIGRARFSSRTVAVILTHDARKLRNRIAPRRVWRIARAAYKLRTGGIEK
jgi:hypothetical protein